MKAVIFDQDGVIFDDEPLVSKSYEILLKSYGKMPIFDKHGLIQPVGVRGDVVWKLFENKYDIHEDHTILRKKRREIHFKLLQGNIKPLPGLLDLLESLKKHNIKLAVATGSSPKIVSIVLNKLKIKNYFAYVVTGEDFQKSKPDPEPFLVACQKLNVSPNECVAIEDSEAGVLAAKAAGIKVIAVPTQHSKFGDFSKADRTVNSLQSITIDMIQSL